MNVTRCLSLLPLIFPLLAQEETVLPPPAVTPPPAVEIPPVPFIPGATPIDPTAVKLQMPTGINIDIQGSISPVPNQPKQFSVSGPIHLKTNRGEEVFADRALLDLEKSTYTLSGNVSVFSGPIIQRGESVVYDLAQKKLDTSSLSISFDPIILEAGSFEATEDENGNRIFTGHDSGITTHDVENPNFWLRAKTTTVFPDDKIVFDDLKLYIGDTPVFWLPYLSQPLNAALGYRFVPGARSNWGGFLLNTYGIMLGGDSSSVNGPEAPWILSQWHFDMRSRRGLGTGVDFYDTRIQDNNNLGWLKLYHTFDQDPSLSRSGLPRDSVPDSRYRLEFQYRIPLDLHGSDPQADYELNYDLHVLSDNFFLEDFDPQFYRSNAQPDNTVFLTRRTETSLLTALARLRVNDFYRTDSRSPEIIYDQIKRPLFDSPILHEGSTSFGIYEENMADTTRQNLLTPLLTLPDNDPDLQRLFAQVGRYEQVLIAQLRELPPGDPRYDDLFNQLTNPQFDRFHTYHQLSSQMTLGNWLHLSPHLGAGYNRYFSVGGPATDEDRTLFSMGLEASMKFKKDYPDFQWKKMGINGIRHTLQPYANWSYLSTQNLGTDYPAIDRLTFTTRPLPINPARFTAIDDLENWNLMRLGIRNRLLTKRDGASHEWLYMDTYIDSYLDDPELNREFSNLYNDITWSPLPWLAVDLQTQFPIISSGSGYNEFTTAVRFMPTPNFEFSVAHSSLQNHPFLIDSNRIQIRAYNRFNENWGFGILQQWEFDDATLELEQYTLHRNYDNWIVSAGLTHRDNRINDEYGFMVNFTLKDFPSVSVPFRMDAD